MKILITLFVLFGISVSASAKSNKAPVACPEMFLSELFAVEDHIRMAHQGLPNVMQEEYDNFMSAVSANPEVVNCIDEIGETPLTAVFNVQENLCALVETAQFLIDNGAKIDVADETNFLTPLYYAVEAYGTVWGTPDLAYKAAPYCQEEVPEPKLKELVAELIQKGAKTSTNSNNVDDVRAIAREYQVSFLLN